MTPNEKTRDVELALEARILDHDLVRYLQERDIQADEEPNSGDPFTFILSKPIDIEEICWDSASPGNVTKMALARPA